MLPAEQTRFVTERYWELQGLRSVLVGGAYVAVFGLTFVVAGPAPSDIAMVLALAAAFAIILPGMLWLDRYYANTFGTIEPSKATRRKAILVVPGTLFLTMFVERALDLRQMTLFFAACAVFELWIVFRDWPQRPYHLLGSVAAMFAVALQLTGPVDRTGLPIAAFFVVGAAIVVTGMLDHKLLAATLHGARPCNPPGAHADTV